MSLSKLTAVAIINAVSQDVESRRRLHSILSGAARDFAPLPFSAEKEQRQLKKETNSFHETGGFAPR